MKTTKKHIKYAKPGDIILIRAYHYATNKLCYERLAVITTVYEIKTSWAIWYSCINESQVDQHFNVYPKTGMAVGSYYEDFITGI